jgi:hypothetical protein
MNRDEKGQFQSKTTEDAETREPGSGTPVERARAALDDILDRAIRSDDSDRIVEVLKLLARFKDEEKVARDSRLDPLVDRMTVAEKSELQDIVFRAAVIRATVALRIGAKPFMKETYPPAYQARILEAARGRLA